MNGSTTGMANAVATAASTALPPRARMAAPTSAPSGCSATTMPFAALGVRLVTDIAERITRGLPFVGMEKVDLVDRVVLADLARDVGHRVVVEVEDPARRVHPRLLHTRLHRRPVLLGHRRHQRGIGGLLVRRVEERPHLV